MKQSQKLYSVFLNLPHSYSFLFELVEIPQDVAVTSSQDGLRIAAYSNSSFRDAEEKLLQLLSTIDVFAEEKILEKAQLERRLLYEKDFLLKYREYLKPFKIKEKLIICPYKGSCSEVDFSSSIPIVVLDSLLAFGTGSHPTTKLCLEYLASKDLNGKVVVDAGTGSGILAISAAKLGAEKVFAFDIDQIAVDVASRNARLNGVDDRVSVFKGSLEVLSELTADVVVANLTSEIIINNLSYFDRCKASEVALSGVLVKEVPKLLNSLKKMKNYTFVKKKSRAGWSLVELKSVR